MAGKRISRLTVLLLGAASALAAPHAAPADEGKDKPKPAAPAGNLDYWLKQATEAKDEPKQPAEKPVNPFQGRRPFHRDDAVPGVVELSNGKVLPGWVYTTLETPLKIFVKEEQQERRRFVPLINLLSLNAVVEEEKMELRWRWKAMGVPERVYTGEKYPTRRLLWRLRLIDGSEMTGAVKGQPIWVELGNTKVGPMVLHERSKGPIGSTLDDLVYIRRIIVSRRLMDAVVQDAADKAPKADKPDSPAKPAPQADKKQPAAPKP